MLSRIAGGAKVTMLLAKALRDRDVDVRKLAAYAAPNILLERQGEDGFEGTDEKGREGR